MSRSIAIDLVGDDTNLSYLYAHIVRIPPEMTNTPFPIHDGQVCTITITWNLSPLHYDYPDDEIFKLRDYNGGRLDTSNIPKRIWTVQEIRDLNGTFTFTAKQKIGWEALNGQGNDYLFAADTGAGVGGLNDYPTGRLSVPTPAPKVKLTGRTSHFV